MERKEITLEDLQEAELNGLSHILDNLEVTGTAVVRDKDGYNKGEIELTSIKSEDK